MALNLAPKKQMLDLNFDQDSSSEDQEVQRSQQSHEGPTSNEQHSKPQKKKYEKIYDLDADQKKLKRDKFSVNKVQKGLFAKQTDDHMDYENFEIQHKVTKISQQIQAQSKHGKKKQGNKDIDPRIQGENKQKNKKELKPNKVQKYLTLNRQKPMSLQFLQHPSSEQQSSQQHHPNNHSQDKSSDQQQNSQESSAQKKLQSENLLHSKKKLLELDFSSSSSSSSSSEESVESEEQTKKSLQTYLKEFVFDKQPQYQVLDEIRPDERVRACIFRCRAGMNLIWPEYEIRIQSNQQQILYIKKQVNLIKSAYKIFSRTQTGHLRYFGKIESNISGSQYQIFVSQNGVHQNLKAQIYFPSETKSNQPRYFQMICLINGYSIKDLFIPNSNNVSLNQLYKHEANRNKLMLLHTRKPIFNDQIKGFVLNFGGRLKMPSIKNFILEDIQTQKEVLMFGKIDKDNFRLQISNPLNCVIGTAVALIQFESRFME